MNKQILHYRTYIFRFWKEQDAAEEHAKWRFTIEDATRSTRHGFDSLDEVISFLRNLLD